jgi:cyclophilin family peptidyl-prolyl cis-trans isomerase
MKRLGCLLLLAYSNLLSAGTLAFFDLPFGKITVELFDNYKPITVQNFIRCVTNGVYQNSFIHRCIPNFIVQGGGFTTMSKTNPMLATQFFYVPNFGFITNEFNYGRRFSNSYGTLAMAKLEGDPNSATTHWFFNLTNNSTILDTQNGGYTVFGKIIDGTNVLNWFNTLQYGGGASEPTGGLLDLTWWYGPNLAVFSCIPVLYQGLTPPFYPDLIYSDISINPMKLYIKRITTNEIELTWLSVSNKINCIEFLDSITNGWKVLYQTNGTGNIISYKFKPNNNGLYRLSVGF